MTLELRDVERGYSRSEPRILTCKSQTRTISPFSRHSCFDTSDSVIDGSCECENYHSLSGNCHEVLKRSV